MRLAPQALGLLCALVRLEPFKTMGEFDLVGGGISPRLKQVVGTRGLTRVNEAYNCKPLSLSPSQISNSNMSGVLKRTKGLRGNQRGLMVGSPSRPTKPLAIN